MAISYGIFRDQSETCLLYTSEPFKKYSERGCIVTCYTTQPLLFVIQKFFCLFTVSYTHLEVVVVAYGTQRKKDLTGAITQIESKIIGVQSTSSATKALEEMCIRDRLWTSIIGNNIIQAVEYWQVIGGQIRIR